MASETFFWVSTCPLAEKLTPAAAASASAAIRMDMTDLPLDRRIVGISGRVARAFSAGPRLTTRHNLPMTLALARFEGGVVSGSFTRLISGFLVLFLAACSSGGGTNLP